MPTFNFDDPVSSIATAATISFVDDGVTFTFTLSGGLGGLRYSAVIDTVTYFAPSFNNAFTIDITFGFSGQASGTSLQVNGVNSFTSGFSGFPAPGFFSFGTERVNDGVGAFAVGPASAGPFTFIRYTNFVGIGSLVFNSITGMITCFAADTGIATPEGRRPVQDLKPGDVVCTADGGESTVNWVGTQCVDPALADPRQVMPILIEAGALGGGLPERDLYVSPAHAMYLDGMLIEARALVNGSTIRQVTRSEPFTYYHVDTGTHEVILAEGAATETYTDQADPAAFDNAVTRPGGSIPEMAVPRIETGRRMRALPTAA